MAKKTGLGKGLNALFSESIENEEEIENNYQLAFDKVQNIIDRNKNFFERLS